MGAHVTILSRGIERLRYLGQVLHGNLTTLASNPQSVAESVGKADVLIGAVLNNPQKVARLSGDYLVGGGRAVPPTPRESCLAVWTMYPH